AWAHAAPLRAPRPATQRSATKLFRRKEKPLPIRRLAHTPADPAARVRPGAARALGFAPPANRLAPRTTARAPWESPAGLPAAHASLADSTASIVPRAEHSDRFALQFAGAHPPASSSGSCRRLMCRTV